MDCFTKLSYMHSKTFSLFMLTRGVATGGCGGVMPPQKWESCPPIVPNNEHIGANIQKIFYRSVALKELFSQLNIQLTGKYT